MKKKLIFVLLILSTFCLSSCNKAVVDDNKLLVSIEPIKTILSKIVKDNYKVYSIIPGNASPETYSPTIKDMQLMSNSSIFFGVGVPAESSNIVTKLSSTTKIVHLEDSIDYLTLPNGAKDPHCWLSIKCVKKMMNTMLDSIIEIDKSNELFYRENAKDYMCKLDKTNDEINNFFINTKEKEFISYHPSLNYFAKDYGLFSYAIEKNGQEPSPKELVDIIDMAKEKEFTTILYQSSVNSNEVETVAAEIGAITVEYNPLSGDYIDNLILIAKIIRRSLDE